jgi:hypothetical protein
VKTLDGEFVLRGWARQGERSELKKLELSDLVATMVLIESAEGQRFHLNPLLAVGGGEFFFSDGGRSSTDGDGYWLEFVSCSSEKRQKVFSDERVPHRLWARVGSKKAQSHGNWQSFT